MLAVFSDPESVATMHAFVDFMNFNDLKFTDALRTFLQSFRLPGEAQKIDRYMLKFAERYIACNPGVFADAGMSHVDLLSVTKLTQSGRYRLYSCVRYHHVEYGCSFSTDKEEPDDKSRVYQEQPRHQ
jgi:hypothetical protein